MDQANKLLTVCAEFEIVAASHQQRHGHVKLIMTDLFDLVGIQRLYNGGGISEEDAVAMVERNCKYVREELKRSGVFKAKKKQKSVVAPMPQQFDGMKENGSPIGDIAKLNSLMNEFVKVANKTCTQCGHAQEKHHEFRPGTAGTCDHKTSGGRFGDECECLGFESDPYETHDFLDPSGNPMEYDVPEDESLEYDALDKDMDDEVEEHHFKKQKQLALKNEK